MSRRDYTRYNRSPDPWRRRYVDPEPSWVKEKASLTLGKTYTYNEVKGYNKLLLKSGDEVRLVSLRSDLTSHVEIEPLDRAWQGKVHVMSLLLGGL